MKPKGIAGLLVVAGVSLAVGGLWAQSRIPTVAVTRTQRVELVDKDGRTRAEVKTSGEGTFVVLYDGQGRLRTVIGIDSIVFYGTDGKVKHTINAQQGVSE